MKEAIDQRFNDLIQEGDRLIKAIPWDEGEPSYWVEEHQIAQYQKWLGSSANLLNIVATSDSMFAEESEKILGTEDAKSGISSRMVQKMYGLLLSAHDEWALGLLRKIEYMVVAEVFDDFLDYASAYHKGNKKIESSILASVVLEDTVKKIAKKNSIETKGLSLESLIDELVKTNVITPVKAKRIKSYAGVRNHALHAEWDDFDIRDVGLLIDGIRELIDEFL